MLEGWWIELHIPHRTPGRTPGKTLGEGLKSTIGRDLQILKVEQKSNEGLGGRQSTWLSRHDIHTVSGLMVIQHQPTYASMRACEDVVALIWPPTSISG